MPIAPMSSDPQYSLNAICPYFTMFPLEFPLTILKRHPKARSVADPFCGRGTTLFAARLRGLRAYGIDCSPVAVAISEAKLAKLDLDSCLNLARDILSRTKKVEVPPGAFWRRASSL
jgi:DNA modification methylase